MKFAGRLLDSVNTLLFTQLMSSLSAVAMVRPNEMSAFPVAADKKVKMGAGIYLLLFFIMTCHVILHNSPKKLKYEQKLFMQKIVPMRTTVPGLSIPQVTIRSSAMGFP